METQKGRCIWKNGMESPVGDQPRMGSCVFADQELLALIAQGVVTIEQAIATRRLPTNARIVEGRTYCGLQGWCNARQLSGDPVEHPADQPEQQRIHDDEMVNQRFE